MSDETGDDKIEVAFSYAAFGSVYMELAPAEIPQTMDLVAVSSVSPAVPPGDWVVMRRHWSYDYTTQEVRLVVLSLGPWTGD
jgi:hypothetical protein